MKCIRIPDHSKTRPKYNIECPRPRSNTTENLTVKFAEADSVILLHGRTQRQADRQSDKQTEKKTSPRRRKRPLPAPAV